MENLTVKEKGLHPEQKMLKEATAKTFENLHFLNATQSDEFVKKLATSAAPVLGAKASLIFGAIYGNVTIEPTSGGYEDWKFDSSFWGLGAVGGSSIGFMYTAYNSWDAFFKNVTSFHVQSAAEGGGIMQVNFFISDGTPVGQFNGALAGAGIVEGGGPGKWKKK